MSTITVPARFNGPPASGNGGYSCGLIAAHLDRPCAVSLRRPIPLEQLLEVETGEEVRVTGGGELIAEAVAAEPLADWPGPAVDLDAAHDATARFEAPGDGVFDRCFVCGRARHDGFGVFAGPVASDDPAVASPWTPPDWAADEDGAVRPEFVWAALDCPGYFALHGADLALAYLVRQQAEILTRPLAGVEYVAVGMALERSGRKGLAATAILDSGGTVLAHAECLLVEPRLAA